MHEFCLPEETLGRLKKFLESQEAKNISDYSLSQYWQYHSKLMKFEFFRDRISTQGNSGYYIPSKNFDVFQIFRKVFRDPATYLPIIKKKLIVWLSRFLGVENNLSEMSARAAFDAVMNHDAVADITLSPYRINFIELKNKPGVILSSSKVAEYYQSRFGLKVHDHTIHDYYQFNILSGLVGWDGITTVLEIGAGNGNLASLICSNGLKRYIIVDLPNTLCLSMVFMSHLFPDAKIIMPHEALSPFPENADFIFLTPNQIHLIPDNYIDLTINTSSFSEMKKEQIKVYFDLIERSCKNGGYFYTRNRVEKLPGIPGILENEQAIRFSEFPWNPRNRVIAYEVCRLGRLTQRDNMFIRLEQVIK